MKIELSRMETPLGPMIVAQRDGALRALEFAEREETLRAKLEAHARGPVEFSRVPASGEIVERLRAYFTGDLGALERIPVAPEGTPFQRRVWGTLRRIPPGRTASYREIARSLGLPGGSRAVGSANARNPVAVVVPCHRVVRSDGTLCGYAGGVERKAWLLAHEGARPAARAAR